MRSTHLAGSKRNVDEIFQHNQLQSHSEGNQNFNIPQSDHDAELDNGNRGNQPAMFQWISMENNGKTSNPRTVRSHVKKREHERRRQLKRESLGGSAQPLQGQLGSASSVSSYATVLLSVTPDETVRTDDKDETIHQLAGSEEIPNALSVTVYNQANHFIPYAWFETNGPVLYVNRLKWPFSTPLHVTGSDRVPAPHKSLTPRQSGWSPYIRTPDTMAVKGAVLDSKVLVWIGQSPECFRFRVDTIQWIQGQLEDPVKAISNPTIGAIMTFAMWTAGYSNPTEMVNHMDAIERIVNLRGGFHSFLSDRLMGNKLALFDSMIAVQTGNPPRFPRVDYFIAQPITPTINERNIHQESPLYGSGNFAGVVKHHQDLEAIVSLLFKMWQFTQIIQLKHHPQMLRASLPKPVPFLTEPRTHYAAPLLTLPLVSNCTNPTHPHILETLRSAGAIYERVLSNAAADFPSPTNTAPFQQLYVAFGKCSHEEFWLRYPGILLWVILVGTATARGKEEAAFWMFYLSRTGAYSSVEGQLAGTEAIRRFLDVQTWIRERNALSYNDTCA